LKQLGNVNFDRSTRLPDLFGSSLLTIALAANGWSIYGAQRVQPVATGGKWDALEKPLKQADPQLVATHGNRFAAHGKEGVDGSSPSKGFTKSLQKGPFFSL
jgi:hypothetical protein